MSFYSELKRRNVIRVAVGYVVTAWLLIQVAETIFPLFGFDDGPARIVVILLVIGFLPTLVVAWIFELTPGGLKKDEDVDRSLASVAATARRFDRIVMLVLVLAVSYFAFDKFILSESREQAIAEAAREFGMNEALAAYTSNESIAVLPFVDISPDRDQEYFADGITEEILNELAQLEGLNVTGRTSSFAFKDHNEDLRIIGEQLGVANILEGSVRKIGNNLRVTAQLINSQSGFHLWTNTYNRRTDDIFDVQEEIARAVAGALSVTLDIDGRNVLPGTGTSNIQAYDAYLQGRAYRRAGKVDEAMGFFELALDLDSNYAEALTAKAEIIAGSTYSLPSSEARDVQESARQLVAQAAELNPDLAIAYDRLGAFEWARKNWIGAAEYHEKYSALAPADIAARLGNANLLGRTGRLRRAIRVDEFQELVDPLNGSNKYLQAEHYIQSGRYDDALATLAKADSIRGPSQGTYFARFFLAVTLGESEGIRAALKAYSEWDEAVSTVVNEILGEFDSGPDALLELMRQIYLTDDELTGNGRMIIASLAAHYGHADFALEIFSEELSENMLRTRRLWYPFFSDMRSLPGFKALANDIGFVDYWRKFGWADTCRPLDDDDFECS
jgi:TolB-like protein